MDVAKCGVGEEWRSTGWGNKRGGAAQNLRVNWIKQILSRDSLLHCYIEREIEGLKIMVRRRMQLNNGIREKRKYRELKNEVRDRKNGENNVRYK